jgi:hypothetical protein
MTGSSPVHPAIYCKTCSPWGQVFFIGSKALRKVATPFGLEPRKARFAVLGASEKPRTACRDGRIALA